MFDDHIDEIWSIGSADMINYESSNNNGIRYKFTILDDFPKNTWNIPLKYKKSSNNNR